MMNAWLIYRKADAQLNQSYIQWFIKEANEQQIDLQLVYRENLHIGIKNNIPVISIHNDDSDCYPDFVIIRTREPLLQAHFQALNIPSFNNDFVSKTSNHKAYTYLELSKLGIPMVPTCFLPSTIQIEKPPFSYPFVLKSATGHGGSQVYFVNDPSEWSYYLQQLKGNDMIIQSTDNIQLGKDVRVFVVGTKIMAAVLRHNQQDFRANYTLGGTVSPFHLTSAMEKMIYQIIRHFEFGLVGIDFLLTEKNELRFNEIEDVVGSRSLSETSEINLLEIYIHHIKQKLTKKKRHQP